MNNTYDVSSMINALILLFMCYISYIHINDVLMMYDVTLNIDASVLICVFNIIEVFIHRIHCYFEIASLILKKF